MASTISSTATPGRRRTAIALLLAGLVTLVACAEESTDVVETTTTVTDGPSLPDPNDLASVCFSPIVVQTD